MNLRIAIASLALTSLMACGLYRSTEVPAVMDYFSKQLTSQELQRVHEVAACLNRDGYQSAWYATVQLDDQTVYHYKLAAGEDAEQEKTALELRYQRTAGEHELDRKEGEGSYLGCLGSNREEEFWIRDEVNWGRRKTAYAPDSVVANAPFNDATKTRVRMAALAVKSAIALNKTRVPNEVTWGVSRNR